MGEFKENQVNGKCRIEADKNAAKYIYTGRIEGGFKEGAGMLVGRIGEEEVKVEGE